MTSEAQLFVIIELVDIEEDVTAERAIAQMDRSPQSARVEAAPVHDEIRVDDGVTRVEINLHTPGQLHQWIEQQLTALLLAVGAAVTARHEPQHIVVVEGDVPLYVARHVVLQIRLQPTEGCLFRSA